MGGSGCVMVRSCYHPGMDDPVASRIAGLLDSAERILGLTVVVHDHAGLLVDMAIPDRHFHRHIFCREGRTDGSAHDRRCQEHCRHAIPGRLAEAGIPMVHTCWKGGSEACAAVLREGVPVFTLFAGVARSGPAPPAGLDPGSRRVWRSLPVADPARLQDAALILQALGRSMLAEIAAAGGAQGTRRAVVERCLADGVHGGMDIAEVARRLGVTPSRAAHIVAAQCGAPFGVLLRERRLARARHLLATTDRPAAEIARACGFGEAHWFHRLFRRRFGMAPGDWRRRNRSPA